MRPTGLETKKERKSKRTPYISFVILFLGNEPGCAWVYMQLELDISTLCVQHFRCKVSCYHTAKYAMRSIHSYSSCPLPHSYCCLTAPLQFTRCFPSVHSSQNEIAIPTYSEWSGKYHSPVGGEVVLRHVSQDEMAQSRSSMFRGGTLTTNRIFGEVGMVTSGCSVWPSHWMNPAPL